jgi:hypothetical protein
VLALLLGRFGGQPDMVAFCYLGAVGVSLAAIDISVQRRHWLTAWAARQRPGQPCQPAARLARQRGAAMVRSQGREIAGHGTCFEITGGLAVVTM